MPCDTRLKPKQTIQERAAEVRKMVQQLAEGLAAGRIKPKVGPQGGITFVNKDGTPLTNEQRDGVTDACAYRRIMATGPAMARMLLSQVIGVNRQAIAQGWHSHDAGKTWHHGH